MFNLPKVYIDNACYISVSSVGVFFSNSFRINEMGDGVQRDGVQR